MIYADQRWIGNHGIGRFARNVLGGIDYRPVPLDGHPASALDSYRLSRAIRKLKQDDVFYSPGYNAPLSCPASFVFTIHDLSHVYCPENSSALIQFYYATILKRACRQAAAILTVSEFTRAQIVAWSGVQPGKVLNVGCGVDPSYVPEGDRYGLSFPYLLCVSNRKRHKNEFRVVEAFARSGIAPAVKLVFSGSGAAGIAAHISEHGLTGNVHFAGTVEESRLPSLYRGATALLFPSLYEGFGLPIVEAMACGTPVITSNVTAMPEIAGDAASLVDPTSVVEIATAISRLMGDASLRAELRAKGLARAATFSWSKTVNAVRDVLKDHSA
jgi:glycosyltransferase involved in cell wall biosynthesis